MSSKNLYSYNDFLPTPLNTLPNWVIQSFNELDINLNKKDFPCLLGIIAHKKQLTKVGFIDKDEKNIGLKLSNIIYEYLDILRNLDNKEHIGLLPLIVFLEISNEKSLEDTHHSAWKCLIEAHHYDKRDWLTDIPKNSNSDKFAYCFDGEIWFINVSSPFHNQRQSRNLGSSIVLAMQTLSGSNCFYKDFEDKLLWQKKIRERTKKYDNGMEVYEGLGSLFNHGKPRPLPESYFLPDNNNSYFYKFWKDDLYQYSHILFDLDGTLIDSSECAIISTQKAFAELGIDIPSSETIVHFMGIPIEISFKKMGAEHLDDINFNNLLSLFRNYYRTESYNHIKPFPYMKECLSQLKNQGRKIAIVTSKKTDVAISNIKQLEIDAYIDFIIGADKVSKPKPNPESIITTLNYFNLLPHNFKNVIMIGDTTFDIHMGKDIQIDTCAVTWGAHHIDLLSESQPTYIVNNFIELLDILNNKIIECPFKSS